MKKSSSIHSFVTIDGDYSDGEYRAYPCVLDPSIRWNGFACPHFTPAIFERICRDLEYRVDNQNCELYDKYGNEPHSFGSIMIEADGEKQWMFYFDGWCWS
jgi:hypothetical protein